MSTANVGGRDAPDKAKLTVDLSDHLRSFFHGGICFEESCARVLLIP
jgi:hypothetical protein